MLDVKLPSESPPQPTAATQRFECEVRSSGYAATWIRTCGDLDLAGAPEFHEAVEAALSRARLIIVDLRQLTFIDSTGLHVIIDADARARRSGRRLLFVRGPATIDRLFELLGLSSRLEIIDLAPVLVSDPVIASPDPADAP